MRKVVVNEFVSLDGVGQAAGGPEEDRSGGFARGGWHMPYMEDELARKSVLDGILEAGGFLLGRRTYEIFAGYWPNAGEEQRAIAEPLNTKPKYVASTTLEDPLEWQNSRVLASDLGGAVAAIKREEGADLHVIGSTQLVQSLLRHDVVDEFRLVIDPVVLGGGKSPFPSDGIIRKLRLVESVTTSTGAIFATYVPAGA